MKKTVMLAALVLCLFFTGQVKASNFYSPLLPKEFLKNPPVGVYRGSTLIYDEPSNTLLYLSFYADDYVTTEILGTAIDGDFWVTDGYFYTAGTAPSVNAAVYTIPYGTLYYDGPLD